MNTQLQNKTYENWCGVVFLTAVWWVVGLNLFFYHLVVFFFLIRFSQVSNRRFNEPFFIPLSAQLIGSIAIFYLLSIVVHIFFAGTGRLLAAVYNLSFWIIGCFITVVMANEYANNVKMPVLKAFYGVAWAGAFFVLIALALTKMGHGEVIVNTPFYKIGGALGKTQLMKDSLQIKLLLWDWFASGKRPRFNVFSPYPTAGAAVLMITLVMISTHALIERQTKKPLFLALFMLNFVGLLMTLSRISILAFLFGFFVVFLLQRKNVSIWMVCLFIVGLCILPFLVNAMTYVLEMREGSTSVRMQLYMHSIQQLSGLEWFIGLGIKPREDIFLIPLGSHSTYVSLLFKSGLLGFGFFILFQATLMFRWYQLKLYAARRRKDFLFWRALGWIFFSMTLWMLTEDIDAPQVLAFFYFSAVGMFEGLRRRILQ